MTNATTHKQAQYQLRLAIRVYQFDRKALAQANKMQDSRWRSRAMSNINRSRAKLKRAIVTANALLGRTA